MKLCFFVLFLSVSFAAAQDTRLQRELDRAFRGSESAVLIVDITNGKRIAAAHPEVFRQPLPPGSLMKVFTLISYYRDYGDRFPEFDCPARLPSDQQGCWDKNGHGSVHIQKAVSFSCNVYFRQLAARVNTETFLRTLREYDLAYDSMNQFAEGDLRQLMVGSTAIYRVEPVAMLRAYCSFLNGGRLWKEERRSEKYVFLPAVPLSIVRAGMKSGAEEGTSMLARQRAGDLPLLGKTGTTVRIKGEFIVRNATQGWWIGFYPAEKPTIAVMAFAPGRGSTDAAPAGGHAIALYKQFAQ